MKYLGLLGALCGVLFAQDSTAILEGLVTDPSGGSIAGATVSAVSDRTGFKRSQTTTSAGTYNFALPAGDYMLTVSMPGFATHRHNGVQLSVSQTRRLDIQLIIAKEAETVEVTAEATLVELGSNAVGNVVTGRQLVDLPLNGRNFAQLGLLQPGVAPLTQGLEKAGGSLRGGQAYAVNGQRPESNNYLLDGVTNINRVDGGYALKTPVDAIQEFRILTQTAPPEFGGTSGSTTTVITRSGSNSYHGALYEFLRNDHLDARNFLASAVEPLKQNQFGGTFGGPLRRNRDFFFGYYEGFRNRAGVTQSATVPSDAQRAGDFSGMRDPQTGQPVPLVNYFTGEQFPGNRIPVEAQDPVARKLVDFYPHANAGPNLYVTTQVVRNGADQGGLRYDHIFHDRDQLAFRYARAQSSNIDPLSIAGANVPGFPVGEDIGTHSAVLSETHLFSPTTTNVLRLGFFRNGFDTDKPLNKTSLRQLGFNYDSTLASASGPPFLIVSGYASTGNPITGPRDTTQNTYEIQESLSRVSGAHSFKFGAEFRRTQINMSEGIASNGFFVFAPFPASDSFASFLLGFPVVFFQGGGDMNRGLRNADFGLYAQDEWRVSSRLTVNYGLRWEVNTPFVDIRNRMNAWSPLACSRTCSRTRRKDCYFPAIPASRTGSPPLTGKD